MNPIDIPPAGLAAGARNDDEALDRRRAEIRKRLLEGEKVVVTKKGEVKDPDKDQDNSIQVPPGKLAGAAGPGRRA